MNIARPLESQNVKSRRSRITASAVGIAARIAGWTNSRLVRSSSPQIRRISAPGSWVTLTLADDRHAVVIAFHFLAVPAQGSGDRLGRRGLGLSEASLPKAGL